MPKILTYAITALIIVTSATQPLSAIANPPICDFTKGASGLSDFNAGKCVCDINFYAGNDITMYSPCPETCAVGDSYSSALVGKDNREKILNFLLSQALSVEQASGILGNIQSESGGTFSPTINEFSGGFPTGGYGIVQWTGGRRTNVVDYMTQKNPALMAKYYKADYSTQGASYTGIDEGFVPKSASTGEQMPVEDNDALLLSQLEFLMTETTGRTIRSVTASKVPGISVGDNEWESIKKQTTVKGASDVWVYNFEIPADIDTTAAARVVNGENIYSLYANTSTSIDQCEDGLLGDTRAKVVQVAEAEYAKWESGEMKAGTDFRVYLEGNGDTEWCAYFVSWVYKQAGYTVTERGAPYSGVSQLENATDRFDIHPADGSYTPVPGDIVSYGYHTNLVVAVSADNPRDFTTIGGNEGPVNVTVYDRKVKKSSGTYWAGEAQYYISPKG